MEFAVVNNYMGPVATKVMKGYSEDDVRVGDEFKVIFRAPVKLELLRKTVINASNKRIERALLNVLITEKSAVSPSSKSKVDGNSATSDIIPVQNVRVFGALASPARIRTFGARTKFGSNVFVRFLGVQPNGCKQTGTPFYFRRDTVTHAVTGR